MIAIDTNVLVYAHRRDMPLHEPAKRAVRGCAEGGESWAMLWPCVHEFLAITTHPRVFKQPSSTDQALAQVRVWLGSPTVALLGETDTHLDVLAQLLASSKATGPKIHDARIAALCLTHGVRELWTADRDFSWFSGLLTRNPLVG